MQFDQPNPSVPDGGQNQYDFILNGQHKPKKSWLPQTNNPRTGLVYKILAVLAVLFVLAIVAALLLGGRDNGKKNLVAIAQTQTEIVRVSSAGVNQAKSSNAQQFTTTIASTMQTSQQQTVKYLSSQGNKVSAKQLALGKNSQTDATLKTATEAGTYDQALITALEKMLADYKTQLSQAYSQTSSTSQKKLIQGLYTQVEILIKNQPAATNS